MKLTIIQKPYSILLLGVLVAVFIGFSTSVFALTPSSQTEKKPTVVDWALVARSDAIIVINSEDVTSINNTSNRPYKYYAVENVKALQPSGGKLTIQRLSFSNYEKKPLIVGKSILFLAKTTVLATEYVVMHEVEFSERNLNLIAAGFKSIERYEALSFSFQLNDTREVFKQVQSLVNALSNDETEQLVTATQILDMAEVAVPYLIYLLDESDVAYNNEWLLLPSSFEIWHGKPKTLNSAIVMLLSSLTGHNFGDYDEYRDEFDDVDKVVRGWKAYMGCLLAKECGESSVVD